MKPICRFTLSLIPMHLVLYAHAGTVALRPPTVESNRYVIPIALDGAEAGVASLNFQVQYDPSVFTPVGVEAGAIAQAAGKLVDANLASPGTYNVLVMGINQTALPDGEVARVVLERNPDVTGSTRVQVADTTLASADGSVLPSTGSSQTLKLGETAGDIESPEESEDSPDDDVAEPETEPKPEEPEEVAPEDVLSEDLGRDVANAMLVGLASATLDDANEASSSGSAPQVGKPVEAATAVVGKDTPETLPVAIPAGGALMERPAQTQDDVDKDLNPAHGPVPNRVAQAPGPNIPEASPQTRLTVEDNNNAVTPEAQQQSAQEGGQAGVQWNGVFIAVLLVATIAAAFWWSRRRVTRL